MALFLRTLSRSLRCESSGLFLKQRFVAGPCYLAFSSSHININSTGQRAFSTCCVNFTTPGPTLNPTPPHPTPHSTWTINMLYDSQCPLCVHEINFLQKRDTTGRIKFTDISKLDYKPEDNGDISYEEGMRKIHAVLLDGQVLKGIDVFERVYGAVGLGWVYSFAKVPMLYRLGEKVYDYWARKRMWITGRPELDEVFKQRQEALEHLRNSGNLEEKVCKPKYQS